MNDKNKTKLAKVPVNMPEIPWLLKKSSSASAEIGVPLAPLDGKVFEMQKKKNVQKEQKKKIKENKAQGQRKGQGKIRERQYQA